jgi:predicted membrane-bound spermidine synthase
VCLLALLGLLALLVSIGISTAVGTGLVPVAGLLFVIGALVAAVFGRASVRGFQDRARQQTRLVAPLYAADVLGGCVGSIVASLFLIPLLGLPLTGEWVAALTGVAAVAWSRGWD